MFKSFIVKLSWILDVQFGLSPQRFVLGLFGLKKYFIDLWKFKSSNFSGNLELKPCLHDANQNAGAINSEYFWQDLVVAKKIYYNKPNLHLDIGSRIDGFIAHVASFREIEVFDVRPLDINFSGIKFKQIDIMDCKNVNQLTLDKDGYCDSLSSLHAIEHFGLGRYGDPIDPEGYKKAISNMCKLLKKDGLLYISTPIGIEKVQFNANRIFNPSNLKNLISSFGMNCESFIIFDSTGLTEIKKIDEETLLEFSKKNYSLGLFIFKKI